MPVYSHRDAVPRLGKGVYVAPTGVVIGDVELGDDASIWFGTVLRGDCFPIRVGARTNIQDGTVVHVTGGRSRTTIGAGVTVGHMALLHGCTIGDAVLVGMGAIVLDDAVVGDECFIAAGALVTPRTKIPPRSFVVGRPAKVLRPVKVEELEWIREAERLYVGYKDAFLREVHPVT
jgi:gamma-carbonic anhydrase